MPVYIILLVLSAFAFNIYLIRLYIMKDSGRLSFTHERKRFMNNMKYLGMPYHYALQELGKINTLSELKERNDKMKEEINTYLKKKHDRSTTNHTKK